jgi:membrane fusion protein, multidrug efflux system
MEDTSPSNRRDPAPPTGSGAVSLPPPRARRRFRLSYVIAAVAVLLVAGGTVWFYRHFIEPYETTDDAFIDGYVTFVSPQVAGPVVQLLVTDNQRVKAGDVLIEIDPRNFETQVAQTRADLAAAKARLGQAKAQVAVDQAKVEQQQAALTAAQAIAVRAEADRMRYEAVQSQAVSRTQRDLAKAQASSTAAEVEAARSQVHAAAAQLEPDRANIEAAAAQVEQAEARAQQAGLDLSYTQVKAPRNGRVTERTVQQGNYVQVGQVLLAIVPDDVWVVANFKETQLQRMRPGQPVSLHVDAYPQHEFKGKVDSLQAGSGARFSLLPPENAVGNYVKVVQRVPVKIVFDETINESNFDIAPGMSVEPKVRVQ